MESIFSLLYLKKAGLASRNIVHIQKRSFYVVSTSAFIFLILQGISETFGSRSIFLALDRNGGSKLDTHPISIDFTCYKNTKQLFRAFLTLNLVVRLFVSNT